MIHRFFVDCSGCGCNILLRLSIGRHGVHNFFYVCESCNATTKGALTVKTLPEPQATLSLVDASLLTIEPTIFHTVSVHPELPAIQGVTDLRDDGGSPFMKLGEILGDRVHEWGQRRSVFLNTVDESWTQIQRLFGYYSDGNWNQFDREAAAIYEESWCEPICEVKRQDAMHMAIEYLLMPLCVQPFSMEMKEEWVGLVTRGFENSPSETKAYFHSLNDDPEITSLQKDLFHCVSLCVKNRDAIVPSLPLLMTEDESDWSNARLFQDAFPELRDQFIASFEACHHTLPIVAGLINVLERGDPNAFQANKPRNLKKFAKAPNATKLESLRELSVWHQHWPTILNRKMRNAIGHHTIRHDLSTGYLTQRGDAPVSYLEFVKTVAVSLQAVLISLEVLKYVRVMTALTSSPTA